MQFQTDLLVSELVLGSHDPDPLHVDVVDLPVVPCTGLLLLDPALLQDWTLLKKCPKLLQLGHSLGWLLILMLGLGSGFHLNFKLISR